MKRSLVVFGMMSDFFFAPVRYDSLIERDPI